MISSDPEQAEPSGKPLFDPVTVVFICTGNICRSRMAEQLMKSQMIAREVPGLVLSRGILPGSRSVPEEVEATLLSLGTDTDCLLRESQALTPADLEQADLVIGMTREHVRHSIVMKPASWRRSFTLKELVRRGALAGARANSEVISEWLNRVGLGRERSEMIGDSPIDDVADPIGLPYAAYLATGTEIAGLIADLSNLLWPVCQSAQSQGTGKAR